MFSVFLLIFICYFNCNILPQNVTEYSEKIDGLSPGLSRYNDVIKTFGQPDAIEISEEWEVNGLKGGGHKILKYPSKGIIVFINKSEKTKKNPVIDEISAIYPFTGKVLNNLKIGMNMKDAVDICEKKYYRKSAYEGIYSFARSKDSDSHLILSFLDYKLIKITLVAIKEKVNKQNIIAYYKGSGTQNTKPFITNSSWEIQWYFKGELFQVYLQSPKEEIWEVLASQSGSNAGSSYYPKAGIYYLKVNSDGEWEIKIVSLDK